VDLLSQLSKSATSLWLAVFEFSLLAFGAVLVIGLVGEYSESDRWKRFVKAFELMVILGVAGELLADGGIFLLSRRLQILSDIDVAQLSQEAATATATAKGLELQIAAANERAANAENETARLNKMAEDERAARLNIEKTIGPRSLNAAQTKKLEANLQSFAGLSIDVFGYYWGKQEGKDFTNTLAKVLNESGWHAHIFWDANVDVPISDVRVETALGPNYQREFNAALALQKALSEFKIRVTGPTTIGLPGAVAVSGYGAATAGTTPDAHIRLFIGKQ
jgi:hypothetical protein